MRSQADVTRALMLIDDGHTATRVARLTGIPRSTVRDWSAGRNLRKKRRGDSRAPCEWDHEFAELEAESYGYLLGLYLGDGCVSRAREVWRLRITIDAAYPGVVQECAAAIEVIADGKRPTFGAGAASAVPKSPHTGSTGRVSFRNMGEARSTSGGSRSASGSGRSSWLTHDHYSADSYSRDS
jgi:hypothetical protein